MGNNKTKLIPLTQGKFALVDEGDFEYLNQWKWHVVKKCRKYYATRKQVIAKGMSDGVGKYGYIMKTIYMHSLFVDVLSGSEVDHINGDSLDNRRENLRVCTHQENLQNSKTRCDNTSGYRGVTWDKQLRKWFVRCTANGHNYHVGYFIDLKEAAIAYNVVAKKQYGEYARLNDV